MWISQRQIMIDWKRPPTTHPPVTVRQVCCFRQIIILEMLELRRQTAVEKCPVREEEENCQGGGSAVIPWPGMKYACLKVIQAYCKVFEQQDLYDLIVRYASCSLSQSFVLWRWKCRVRRILTSSWTWSWSQFNHNHFVSTFCGHFSFDYFLPLINYSHFPIAPPDDGCVYTF